jgi:ectoine hydroxylase-related dioxygenase (phytanoyl-CoA dioxygenase family)
MKNAYMEEEKKRRLDALGYVVLDDFMEPELLEGLRRHVEELLVEEGERAGSEFKQEPQSRRLANLVDKGEIFRQAIAAPETLQYVGHVLGPEFKLSSLNFRSANPHSDWVQPLHADMGAIPDEKGYWVCNTIWLLDDFTLKNGATRAVPGSHLWGKLPNDVLANPAAGHPQEVLVTAKAGAVVIMNAHVWHGGTANTTSCHRRAMHAFYTRWDKPQQQYQKRLLRLEVQQQLSPALRKLLALDDPLNDRLCCKVTGQSGFLR